MLRDLLVEDYDDCACVVETFDMYESARAVVLDGPQPRMLGPVWEPGPIEFDGYKVMEVPLRPEPVTEEDLARAFALAADLAPNDSLWVRDLEPVAQLVPVGWRCSSELPVMEVPFLKKPMLVAEKDFLGQWIHNRVNHGLVIFLHGVSAV